MNITTENLQTAIDRIQNRIGPIGDEMNMLDGQLGDGDLGVTLVNGFNNLAEIRDDLPEDLGKALFNAAKAITAVSGSSFGTLMATALMAAGKSVKGETSVALTRLPDLLASAQEAMIARGGASLGDKTMLDVLDSVIAALREAGDDPRNMQQAALSAANKTLDEYRGKPNKVGRARVYSEKSVGLDDPGMMAVKRLIECLAA
ncbi:dihydroxyacetone kinase subunit L [Paracoccus seriniphilus]|uniref:Dihydroxyacetone kinase, C-terminal domain n=1 Tax=Paracoccus seriniphilus TaxID=184748 RepID=A0A239PWB6_9RHOB|nr:dihydroxyacetone kinase subunit L [Paracoccus seriniphilus]WCR13136.1 dihydroxyacetone kinase subunit L [Paracoccus seriniphilus]SNT74594.1 dihydroxyacetone kinase, C-terminal domain [Paracoccus seriniphilus]